MLPKFSSIIIDPLQGETEYFKDLLRYRELFYFLAWRDVMVRYKQTLLGVFWAIIRPILNMIIFTFVFGKIANLSTFGVNYPLFVLAAMLPWQLFANSLADTSQSLINNAAMISKVYFPRFILVTSHIMVHLLDFFISLLFFFIFFCFTDTPFSRNIFFLPFFLVLTLTLSLGTGLWMAALGVRFRDLRFIVPFLIQFGVFISPVGYSSFLLPPSWEILYFLNPMAGIIEGFRWCFFGLDSPYLFLALSLSVLMNGLILISGFQFFRKMERTFADII